MPKDSENEEILIAANGRTATAAEAEAALNLLFFEGYKNNAMVCRLRLALMSAAGLAYKANRELGDVVHDSIIGVALADEAQSRSAFRVVKEARQAAASGPPPNGRASSG